MRIFAKIGMLCLGIYLLHGCASAPPPVPMTYIDECKNNVWFLQYDGFKPADCFTSDGQGRAATQPIYLHRPHCHVCGPLCARVGDSNQLCGSCKKGCRSDGDYCDNRCFLRTSRGGSAPVFHCEVDC